MFAGETYAAVRRFVCPKGRAGARRRGFRIEPGYDHQDVPVFGAARLCAVQGSRPFDELTKLGPLVPIIDAIREADKTAPPKQRHMAKRIFERLRCRSPIRPRWARRGICFFWRRADLDFVGQSQNRSCADSRRRQAPAQPRLHGARQPLPISGAVWPAGERERQRQGRSSGEVFPGELPHALAAHSFVRGPSPPGRTRCVERYARPPTARPSSAVDQLLQSRY
jgi:hypothetical protein